MLTRTFHQGPGPGQGLHSQVKDQDKDKDLSKCGHISVKAFKLMQKTWENYIEMEVNLKRGEMGTYHRQLRTMWSK